MGKIIEKVIIKNFGDVLKYNEGMINENQIRTVELDAIVDTGATFLSIPPDRIRQLGLTYSHSRNVRTANGEVKRRVFAGVLISVLGRETQASVMENDETTPALIGYLILEDLDLVPDPGSKKLIPNPAHDRKWIVDLFYVF